jgi:UPF0755 protein
MRRLSIRLAVLALLGAGGFAGWFAWFALSPLRLASAPLDVSIEAGSSMKQVSARLAEAGAGFAPWQFTLLARLRDSTGAIKAGSYEIEAGTTPMGLLDRLTRGDVSQAELALIEGWSFRQVRAALDQHPALRHDSRDLSEREILARIGADEAAAEGLLFPDTYLFHKNSSDLDLLRRAYRAMRAQLQREWSARAADTPYASVYEALILASIVEKETGAAADRGLIAAVFVNRLKGGMPLQSDPTVIYGIGAGFDGNLRKPDLQRDTPYNTYTRTGLPPTPIALPGLAALRAALNPATSDHLYFVARGDGSSEFSRTLDEHNRAVARYQKRRGS